MADVPQRGLGVAAGLEPELARELASRCAGYGFSAMWSNDHPMASGLETAAVFADAAPELDVGIAVLALDRHTPESVAEKIKAVGLDPARLWVGIGAGFTKRPLGTVEEGLENMRSALPAGTRVAVAAMGPKMCRLAGARADGVFLNWMTPERAAWAGERIQEGATEANREKAPLTLGYVRVAVGPGAPERLRKEESFYRGLHQGYIRHFEALQAPEGTVGVAEEDPAAVAPKLGEYQRSIDHIVVRALAHADADALSAVAGAAAPGR